jgi:hypothetical protein
LRSLDLHNNEIDDDGAVALAASTTLENLVELTLSGNRIGDRGVAALLAWPKLARLTRFLIHNNDCGRETKRALAARFGWELSEDESQEA